MSNCGPICPRCGGTFVCGAANGSCACFDLALSDSLRQQIAASFNDCLCVSCLTDLSEAGKSLTSQAGFESLTGEK
jgi:hypothetical protein